LKKASLEEGEPSLDDAGAVGYFYGQSQNIELLLFFQDVNG